MLWRITSFFSKPKVAMIMMLIIFLTSLPFALALAFPHFIGTDNKLLGSGFSKPESDSLKAANNLEKTFGLSTHNSLVVVYHSESDRLVTDPNVKEAIGKSLDRISSYTGQVRSNISLLTSADPSLVAANQKTTYAVLNINGNDQEVQNLVPLVRDASRIQGLQVLVGGGPSFYYDLQNQGKHDIFLAEGIGIFLIALAMFILGRFYGFGLSVFVSLILAVTAIPISWAILYGFSLIIDVSIFSMSIASMLTLAFTTNYSLLLIKTYRRFASVNPLTAFSKTKDSALKTVLGAGLLAVLAGIWLAFANDILEFVGLGNLTSGSNLVFRSIGLSALIAPAVSVGFSSWGTLVAIKILPSLFQPPINAVGNSIGFWNKLDAWVFDHALLSLLMGLVLVGVSGVSVFHFRWTWAAFDNVKASSESHQAQSLISKEFGEGEASPLFVSYKTNAHDGIWEKQSQLEIEAISNWAKQNENIAKVTSLTTLGIPFDQLQYYWQNNPRALPIDPQGQISFIKIVPKKDFANIDTLAFTKSLQVALKDFPSQAQIELAGIPAENVDFLAYDKEQLFVMLAGMGVILGVVIFGLTQKPVLAFKAVIMAGLTYVATLGLLGWFQGLEKGINGTVPAILLILLAASGTDFEYFLINPARQLHKAGKSNREAVLESLDQNRPVIVIAAFMLFLAFIVWHTSVVEPVRQIGDGMAIGILIDVLLVRFILVPSFMSMMGEMNWWSIKIYLEKEER